MNRRRSRLDSFIARLEAQRIGLDYCAGLVAGVPGPVLELGLGNGRTFDHLRALFPDRAVFAFDRVKASHPASTPDDGHLFLGEFRDTLPAAARRIGALAALAHCDFGSADPAETRAHADFLAQRLPALLAEGAVILSDQPLAGPALRPFSLPDAVPASRYYGYRRAGA